MYRRVELRGRLENLKLILQICCFGEILHSFVLTRLGQGDAMRTLLIFNYVFTEI